MGADFIFVAVPIARTKDEALVQLHSLTDEQIIDRVRYGVYDPSIWTDYYTFDDDGDPVGVNREEFMPVLIEAIETTYEVAYGRYRGGGYFQIGEVTFAMIGEMSWGDPPEFYDELCVTYELGVTYDTAKTLKWVSP